MDAKMVQAIRGRLAGEGTGDLLRMWRENDRERYSEAAFEAVRLILMERGVELPEQEEWRGPVPVAKKARSVEPGSDAFWMGWLKPVLWVGVVLGGLGTAYSAIQLIYTIPGQWLLYGESRMGALAVAAEQWLDLLVPVLLLASAVGSLLKRNHRFRTGMLVWAWVWLGKTVLLLVYVGVVEALYREREGYWWVGWLVRTLHREAFSSIYPLVVLFALTRPQIKRLFDPPAWGFDLAAVGAARGEEADQQGEEDRSYSEEVR